FKALIDDKGDRKIWESLVKNRWGDDIAPAYSLTWKGTYRFLKSIDPSPVAFDEITIPGEKSDLQCKLVKFFLESGQLEKAESTINAMKEGYDKCKAQFERAKYLIESNQMAEKENRIERIKEYTREIISGVNRRFPISLKEKMKRRYAKFLMQGARSEELDIVVKESKRILREMGDHESILFFEKRKFQKEILRFLIKHGRLDLAEHELETFEKRYSEEEDKRSLAKILIQCGHFDKVKSMVNKLDTSLDPDDNELALLNLTELLLERGELENALFLMGVISNRETKDAARLYQVRYLLRKSRFSEAEKTIRKMDTLLIQVRAQLEWAKALQPSEEADKILDEASEAIEKRFGDSETIGEALAKITGLFLECGRPEIGDKIAAIVLEKIHEKEDVEDQIDTLFELVRYFLKRNQREKALEITYKAKDIISTVDDDHEDKIWMQAQLAQSLLKCQKPQEVKSTIDSITNPSFRIKVQLKLFSLFRPSIEDPDKKFLCL
ncbi:MAG: hypothetical protein ACE5GN_01835, partial [Waddliaceae bacterium]